MKQIQKTTALAFFCLVFSFSAHAQLEWTTPTAFTNDSIADNCNAYILPRETTNGNRLYLAWERSTDSTATAIYLKETLNGGSPVEILADEYVHYTHPVLWTYYTLFSTDTLFYLFYETDLNGNRDIRYIKYLADGSFDGPYPFFSTDADEHDFRISNYGGMIVWISNGDLMGSQITNAIGGTFYFENPVVLDEGGCDNPQRATDHNIYYEKQIDTTSYLYNVHGSWGNWDDPILFFDDGNVENLNSDPLGSNLICWSAKTDSSWKMYISNFWSSTDTVVDKESDSPFDPSISAELIGVKSSSTNIPCFLAFPQDTASYQEIYLNMDAFIPSYINFSNSGTDNRNPDTFWGESEVFCFYTYLIWESFENNHWQLYYSKKLNCIGGVQETDAETNQSIHVYPNPVQISTTIAYTLKTASLVKVEILNSKGQVMDVLADENQHSGKHQLNWNPQKEKTAVGIYFMKINVNGQIYARKIVVE